MCSYKSKVEPANESKHNLFEIECPKNTEVFLAGFHRSNLDVIRMCETRLNADLEALY